MIGCHVAKNNRQNYFSIFKFNEITSDRFGIFMKSKYPEL